MDTALAKAGPAEVEILSYGRVDMSPEAIERRRAMYIAKIDEIKGLDSIVIPAGYSKKEDERMAQVRAALNFGAELGLAPYASLRCIYFVRGVVSLHSDGPGAVCESRGILQEFWSAVIGFKQCEAMSQGSDVLKMFPETWRPGLQFECMNLMDRAENNRQWMTGLALAWRKGRSMPIVRSFDTTDALAAHLLDKKGYNGAETTWQTHTKRMLLARAETFAYRDAFPEAFQGLPSADEAAEIAAKDRPGESVTVKETGAAEVLDAAATRQQEGARAAADLERAQVLAFAHKKFGENAAAAMKLAVSIVFGDTEKKTMTKDEWTSIGNELGALSVADQRLKKAAS